MSTNIAFSVSVTQVAVTNPAPFFIQTHYSVDVDEGDYRAAVSWLITNWLGLLLVISQFYLIPTHHIFTYSMLWKV